MVNQMIIQDLSYVDVLARHLPGDPMRDTGTLVDALERQSQIAGDKTAYFFRDIPTTFGELWDGICNFAAYLRYNGVRLGDRVILKLKNSREFFFAYYGIQRLGAVAVPVFHDSTPERIAKIANAAMARALVTPEPLDSEEKYDILALAEIKDFSFQDVREGAAFKGNVDDVPMPRPQKLAMLQYTSGTTGDPKGVMLTHGNLLANVRQMIPKAGFTADDVFVSWLPVYHDMGLITMTMTPFYLGATLVLLPVSLKPDAWFNAIKTYGGTMTAAPDFAYRFATKCSKKGSNYDLSSLRTALIAAEPVRLQTVEEFENKFNLPGVLKPGYGLAESSVAVTFWDRKNEPVKVDANNYVSAGSPLPGLDLAVASDHSFLGFNQVGEIVFRSPSATSGYYRNEEATRKLHFKDGFIRTGDLGYIDEEHNLFIVDRAKNVIIRAGRNISPREIEEIADTIEGVRSSAVFGIDEKRLEGEMIHLLVEINERRPGAGQLLETLPRELTGRVYNSLGYKPDRIIITRQKTIPRTYNGKVKYPQLRSQFLTGKLETRILN